MTDFDNGGSIGGQVLAVNNTGWSIPVYSRAGFKQTLKWMRKWDRDLMAPTKADPYFRRGTTHYREATRILGGRARWIADESVRQINGKWLKVDQFIEGDDGDYVSDPNDWSTLLTESVRIRIPRDSWLRRDFKHRLNRRGIPAFR